MRCENCGSDAVRQREIEGFVVSECQICEQLYGPPESIAKINELREAQTMEIDREIYPLYKTIQTIPTLKVQYAYAGYPQEKAPPYVSFNVAEGNHKYLEQFMACVQQTNRMTNIHWVVEVNSQRGLAFILKPNFQHDAYHISAEEVSLAQKDIKTLASCLREEFQLALPVF